MKLRSGFSEESTRSRNVKKKNKFTRHRTLMNMFSSTSIILKFVLADDLLEGARNLSVFRLMHLRLEYERMHRQPRARFEGIDTLVREIQVQSQL